MIGLNICHKNSPHAGEIVYSLQTEPKAFGARVAIAFTSEETSQAGDHSGGFPKGGRSLRRNRVLFDIGNEGFPFRVFTLICIKRFYRLTCIRIPL